jgi:hypothetical protein
MMFEIFQVFLLSYFSVLWDGFWRFDASLHDITPKRKKIVSNRRDMLFRCVMKQHILYFSANLIFFPR